MTDSIGRGIIARTMTHEMLRTPDESRETFVPETEVQEEFEAIPQSKRYVTEPIEEAFDWEDIVLRIKLKHKIPLHQGLYLVDFQSQRKSQEEAGDNYVPDELLAALDEAVLKEARGSEGEEPTGFLYYFSGEPDENGNNRSFCIWESAEAVQKASLGPDHHQAKLTARDAYKAITFSAYNLSQGPDGKTIHNLVLRKQYPAAA